MSMAALRQGWEDENLQRILAGDRSVSLWADMPPDFAEDLALIRLQILERQQRYIEYLNLARAEGLMQQYLTRLVAVGQVEEAMAAAKTHMSTAETAFALAKALREREHLSEALAIAQTGLTLSGHCLYDLAAWTSDLAQSLSNFSAAVNASIVAFNTRPSFRYYRKVEELVGDSWSTVKQDLLKTLRAYRDWGAEQAKVDIFLYEGLVDDAITVVSSPYFSPELVMRVMETAIPHRPDWVIDNARSRAEPIINQGKADRYDEVVKWLQKVKAAYFQLGQQSQWSDYRSQLTTTHGRKRKLMELFKQLV
ncbi:MAG: SWIM zinc finger domain-containing protein [Fischerella sp.]|uniref:hypothetical protein n=1 Tax=Fischerella sp. TaxID=1191 RepID=UPI0017F3EC94|nr:hypothetical protein [Fischerella sp.]NWF57743.1 SWIM zinc finger domain-containing protein [Fischerella sp.]